MSIVVRCDRCGKKYRVDEKFAGRKVKCRGCEATMVVPRAEAAAAVTAGGRPDVAPAVNRNGPSASVVVTDRAPRPKPPNLTPVPVATSQPTTDARSADSQIDYSFAVPNASRTPADATVLFRGDQALTDCTVWASIGLYTVVLVVIVCRILGGATIGDAGGRSDGEAVERSLELAGILFAAVPAGLCLLCCLGVYAGSKAMKFDRPSGLMLKCLAVVIAPAWINVVMRGFNLASPAVLLPPWWLSIGVVAITLWMVLRLRAAQFAVTLGIVLLLTVVPQTATAVVMNRPDPSAARLAAAEAADRQRLERIGVAVLAYVKTHGRAPLNLEELVRDGSLDRSDVSDNGLPRFQFPCTGVKGPIPSSKVVAQDLAARTRPEFHWLILFGDGHVESVGSNRYGEVMRRSSMAR